MDNCKWLGHRTSLPISKVSKSIFILVKFESPLFSATWQGLYSPNYKKVFVLPFKKKIILILVYWSSKQYDIETEFVIASNPAVHVNAILFFFCFFPRTTFFLYDQLWSFHELSSLSIKIFMYIDLNNKLCHYWWISIKKNLIRLKQ